MEDPNKRPSARKLVEILEENEEINKHTCKNQGKLKKWPIEAQNFEVIALGHFWTKCNEISNLGLKYNCVCPINFSG